MKQVCTWAITGALAALGLFWAGAGHAASVHGCSGLENAGVWASVEGREGVFFRVKPDLYNYHPMTDEAIATVSELSRALAARGTTLVLAPVPTKALAMPHFLGPDADLYSHDGDIAATVYLDGLRRMAAAGLLVAAPYEALAQSDARPYFGPDPRLTAQGGRIMAGAIGVQIRETAGYAGFAKHRFVSEPTGHTAIASDMRLALQQHCDLTLPQAVTETFVTRLDTAAPADQVGVIALVGSEYSDLPEANFAGFLAEATGFDVIQYSLSGGGAFAAITTYLTSAEFQTERPDYLVWEFPVQANLGGHGLQPLEELIAAARGTCPVALDLSVDEDAGRVARAELSDMAMQTHDALLLDLGPVPARAARFAFRTGDGLIRTRVMERHPAQVPTGRFLVPLSGLWPEGAASVEITLDMAFGGAPKLFACERTEP